MNYDLWDVAAGIGIARSRSEEEVWALVRTLLDHYGDAYAESLEPGIEDDDGAVIEMLSGPVLAERARATVPVTD